VNTCLPSKSGRSPTGVIYTPGQIVGYVRRFRRSGLSLAAFARQEGLRDYRLRYWLKRSERRPLTVGRRQFQNVPLNSLLSPAWAAEVVGPGGLTVRLGAQVPRELGLELAALAARI